ncbi:Uncharacterized protein Fot_36195 [Forsythia ovata]|uniref:Uncharacterized protein n=1 Tax=Forsythia ovata TaxID=205694 RepID=A0ABD1SNR4_9LAMI
MNSGWKRLNSDYAKTQMIAADFFARQMTMWKKHLLQKRTPKIYQWSLDLKEDNRMAAAAIQRKDLEKLMQMLNILTEMLIDQRSRRQHGIILSSIIIREPPLSELMINLGAGRTWSLMEKTASFA